jgi:hypothetical protein
MGERTHRVLRGSNDPRGERGGPLGRHLFRQGHRRSEDHGRWKGSRNRTTGEMRRRSANSASRQGALKCRWCARAKAEVSTRSGRSPPLAPRYGIGQARRLPSRRRSQSMPAVSGCSNLAARRSSRSRRSLSGGLPSPRWRAPTIASSRTCRERDSPGGTCGAADRRARVSSGSSVTWMRGRRVGTVELTTRQRADPG